MEKLSVGDLVVTLPKVEKISAIAMRLTRGMIGVVVDHSARFNSVVVYGISIDGNVYYLFEDEIKKLEEKCLIVGLGQAGCNIAELFKQHKQYEVVLLDEGKGIKKQNSVEEYDSIDYKPRRKAIKSATEGILFVCGSGKIAGASLRVLEALKHAKMTVVYIYPDLEFASDIERRRNKVHFNVLQEFTRSGLIQEMLLLDNKILADLTPAGTVYDFYKNINYLIYSTIHTLNYCANVKPEFTSTHTPKEISRISTIGYAKFEEDEEKLYFPLDNITETCYIININEEELANDVSIMPNVKGMVRDNKKLDRDTSFSIWSTTEDTNYYYAKHYTHFIQEQT